MTYGGLRSLYLQKKLLVTHCDWSMLHTAECEVAIARGWRDTCIRVHIEYHCYRLSEEDPSH